MGMAIAKGSGFSRVFGSGSGLGLGFQADSYGAERQNWRVRKRMCWEKADPN
ncbi:MAG: hypothetical protein FWD57_07465 [Polyangiaceae bacterium]|nr:hypothetical protein [Polyangiaceae bacterium]